MTTLISFPFRITGTGSVASNDDGDEDYLAEELGQLIQTIPGERELVPTYGLNDAAFQGFDKAVLIAQVAAFGPPVEISEVTVDVLSDNQNDVVVKFTPALDSIGSFAVGSDIGTTDDSTVNSEEFSD